MKRCLVTGATGFIGTALVDFLAKTGVKVVALYRDAPSTKSDNIKWVQYSDMYSMNWFDVLSDVDTIFHLAWSSLPQTSNEDPVSDLRTNVEGTIRILETLREMQHKVKIVFFSSGGTIYGKLLKESADEEHPTDPSCAYGISKLAVEKYLYLYHNLANIEYLCLRVSNPYGSGQRQIRNFGVVGTFINRILRDQPIQLFGGDPVIRDFIHISDVVTATVAATQIEGSHILNVGTGRGVTLIQLIRLIEQTVGKNARLQYLPARQFDVPYSVLNIDKMQNLTSWYPKTSLEDGVRAVASQSE